MKRITALIIALIMCLALASCGGSNNDESSTAPESTQMGTTDASSSNETEAAEENVDPAVKELTDALVDEWIRIAADENDTYPTSLVINADGTAKYGEEDLTWNISFTSETELHIGFRLDGSLTYTAKLKKSTVENPGTFEISFNKINSKIWRGYYKSSEYTKIDITIDNWEDYFEIKEFPNLVKDAFGEITKIEVVRALVLKDEYGIAHSALSKNIVEYSTKQLGFEVTADKATGEYTIGALVDEHPDWSSYTYTHTATPITSNDASKEASAYGIVIETLLIDDFPTDTVNIRNQIDVLRIIGTIYTYTPGK